MIILSKYLKEYDYYSDLYDRVTIDECLSIISEKAEDVSKMFGTTDDPVKIAKINNVWIEFYRNIRLHFIKGERYLAKEPTIREWMKKDKELDERLDRIPEHSTYCSNCGTIMDCVDKSYRDIDYKRILSMFNCPDCGKSRAFFDDGEEYKPSSKCAKCGGSCTISHERDSKKIISIYTCNVCGNIARRKLDLTDLKPKNIKNEEKIKRKFFADREKYCLNSHDGEEYEESRYAIDSLQSMLDEQKERENNKDLYDKIALIKKLNIAELKELLVKDLSNHDYAHLEFSMPEINRFVSINFTIQDIRIGRDDYDSRKCLKKQITQALGETNWRLVGESLFFRLGVVQGRLRGYESEAALLCLVDPKLAKAGKHKINSLLDDIKT